MHYLNITEQAARLLAAAEKAAGPEAEILWEVESDGFIVGLYEDPHSGMPLVEAIGLSAQHAAENLIILVQRTTTLLDGEVPA